jgi:hypothetical protein
MSRPKAAQRVAAANVTATLADLLSPARAEASRRNGAKSKGPKTAEGKARSARNALKHGLRAEKFVVVGDEDPQEFAAFEAAMLDSLSPQDALQSFFAGRIVRAAWRLERAEQIEAELFAREMKGVFDDEDDLGLALIRDGNGARAFDTLMRYRAAAQAEVFRTLRTLKALQAEAAQDAAADRSPESPIEPDSRTNAGHSRAVAASAPVSPEPEAAAPGPARPASGAPLPAPRLHTCAAPGAQPDEPESPRNPCDSGRPTDRAERGDGGPSPTP